MLLIYTPKNIPDKAADIFPRFGQPKKRKRGENMKSKKESHSKMNQTPSATPVMGQPEDAFELVNKYGTYEIQPTSDSENAFPEIAQGQPHIPENSKSRHKDARP